MCTLKLITYYKTQNNIQVFIAVDSPALDVWESSRKIPFRRSSLIYLFSTQILFPTILTYSLHIVIIKVLKYCHGHGVCLFNLPRVTLERIRESRRPSVYGNLDHLRTPFS